MTIPRAGDANRDTTQALLAAVLAVLSRRTGRRDLMIALKRSSGDATVQVAVAEAETLQSLASQAADGLGRPGPARVVVLDADMCGDSHDWLSRTAEADVSHDLVVFADDVDGGTRFVRCHYDADRYAEETIELFLAGVHDALVTLLAGADARIDTLEAAGEPELLHVAENGASSAGAVSLDGPVESIVAEAWRTALETSEFGPEDNFFALGGSSLQAIQIASSLSERFSLDLPVDLLFALPTIRETASQIEQARSEGDSAPVSGPVRLDALQHAKGNPAPASFSQERIWLSEQLSPATATHHIPWAFDIVGALERSALAQAINAVVERHDVLRTSFGDDEGHPAPTVRSEFLLPMASYDLSDLPRERRQREADILLEERVRQPFDLRRGPLIRADLLRLEAERHILLLTAHHLVSDGHSAQIIASELGAIYDSLIADRPMTLPEPPLQFGDVAAWERATLDTEGFRRAERYWAEDLAGVPACSELPLDRPRPARADYLAEYRQFDIPAPLSAAVRQLAAEHGVTLFTVLLAAFHALLRARSRQTDTVIGITSANRSWPGGEHVVGPVFNMLAIRANLPGDPTFEELLDAVRTQLVGGSRHGHLPFDLVLRQTAVDRELGRPPLFQTFFELPEPLHLADAGGARWSARLVDTNATKFDLLLSVHPGGDLLRAVITFNRDLFDGPTIERLGGDYLTVLDSASTRPRRRLSTLGLPAEPDARPHASVQSAAAHPADPADPALLDGRPAIERLITELWSQRLDVPAARIGPTDNIFGLGGRSLDMAWIAARIRADMRCDLPVSELYRRPTVTALTEAIVEREPRPGAAERVATAVLRARAMSSDERRSFTRARQESRSADHSARRPTDAK